MKKKWIVLIAICAILMVVYLCRGPLTRTFADWYMGYSDRKYAVPETGVYYCEELGAKFDFFGGKCFMAYGENTTVEVFAGYDGCFHSFDGNDHILYAGYYWNQKEDQLKLTVYVFPDNFQENNDYYFVRVN